MNIAQLSTEFKNFQSPSELEDFIAKQIKEIELDLFAKRNEDLTKIYKELQDLYYSLIDCEAFQSLSKSGLTPSLQRLLITLATIFERTTDMVGVCNNLVGYLPESPVKYRLKALVKIHDINTKMKL